MDLVEGRPTLAFFDVCLEVLSVIGCKPGYFLGVSFAWCLVSTLCGNLAHFGARGHLLGLALSTCVSAYFEAALVVAALACVAGRIPGARECLWAAARLMGRILPLAVIFNILTLVGTLLLVVPGVVCAVDFALWSPLVILGKDGGKPFASSRRLVQGHFFGVAVLKFVPMAVSILVLAPLLWGRVNGTPSLFSIEHFLDLAVGPVAATWGSVLIAVIYSRLSQVDGALLVS